MSGTKHVILIHGNWGRGEQLAAAGAAFEARGYTVHTPTLRHHEQPMHEGANKVAALSLRDYTDDLVRLVSSLNSPPLLVGHSMGGLLAQLVAARTRHLGLVAACPAPASGINASTPANRSLARQCFLRLRPWARSVRPPKFEQFQEWIANAQTDDTAREIHDGLVCESGRAQWEMLLAALKLSKATIVHYAAVTTPVLVIGGEFDRVVPAGAVRTTAERYQHGTCVEIVGCDHMVFSGAALPVTMAHIDDWIAKNRVLSIA